MLIFYPPLLGVSPEPLLVVMRGLDPRIHVVGLQGLVYKELFIVSTTFGTPRRG
jgi:hypothetical protein